MDRNKKERFSLRRFVSVLTAVAFVVAIFSGIVLFIRPPGRIANWGGWQLLGLTKHQWESLHIWLSITLVVASLFHVYLNWKALISYFKSRRLRRFAFRLDWVLALLFCAGIVAGALSEISPFSSLLAWQQTIKHSWEAEQQQRPPIPHAELMTLSELAHETNVDLEAIEVNLKARNIAADTQKSTIAELAKERGLTPLALYNVAMGNHLSGRGRGRGQGPGGGCGKNAVQGSLSCSDETQQAEGEGKDRCQGDKDHAPPGGEALGGGEKGKGRGFSMGGGREGGRGRGMGRKTLKQYCADEGLDPGDAIDSLQAAGMVAKEEMTLRDIAESGGIHPREICDLLEKVK